MGDFTDATNPFCRAPSHQRPSRGGAVGLCLAPALVELHDDSTGRSSRISTVPKSAAGKAESIVGREAKWTPLAMPVRVFRGAKHVGREGDSTRISTVTRSGNRSRRTAVRSGGISTSSRRWAPKPRPCCRTLEFYYRAARRTALDETKIQRQPRFDGGDGGKKAVLYVRHRVPYGPRTQTSPVSTRTRKPMRSMPSGPIRAGAETPGATMWRVRGPRHYRGQETRHRFYDLTRRAERQTNIVAHTDDYRKSSIRRIPGPLADWNPFGRPALGGSRAQCPRRVMTPIPRRGR